ncbi:MAG: 50S ribosomal protein L4 [Candidatus Omnitrophica bacterium]|nr:50S ribosomal protein L4 [Candidatus Omnitrophota bacterium]
MKTKSTKIEFKSLELDVLNTNGESVEKINFDETIFDGKINPNLMHQAVVTYLANKRSGLACTKTKGEVRGGGRKPWRQKGTGRARVGSNRSPLWRGGGVTFGPKPHSFNKDLPKKMKLLALKSSLNVKMHEEKIIVLNELTSVSPKTKDFVKIINNLKLDKDKIRLVLVSVENNIKLGSSNLEKVLLCRADDVNTIDVLNCKKLIITKDALKVVQERVKKCL